ncbi:MAG: VWA domain-containing protein [Acidobacteriota bacterium]
MTSHDHSRLHSSSRHQRFAVVLIALVAALCALPLAAQSDSEPLRDRTFEGTVEVSEVLLDVLVTDRDGNIVLGLGPDDFQVVENGEALPVRSVSFYSNRFELDGDAVGVQNPSTDEVLADRHFLFVFDDNTRYAGAGSQIVRRHLQAVQQAKRWVREEMLPGDWLAVLSYDVKLKVHSDFSQDRDALLAAIDRASTGKSEGDWPSRQAVGLGQGPSILDDLPTGKALRDETKTFYKALELLAFAAGDIPGRKNLVLFSIGFGDVRASAGLAVARPDRRYYDDMIEALNDHNIAVYPVDMMPFGVEHIQTDFLNTLAFDTGGLLYDNFVNFITPLREIADENNGYYLLSYQSEHEAGETGYREVTVEVADPNLKVRARRGYLYGA